MTPIFFFKMSGCGNDFIIIDNRDSSLEMPDPPEFVKQVCRRKLSVGADGLILIENSDVADFKWRFFNSDGSIAEMCGNGARCAARFACLQGIAGPSMAFETLAGVVEALVDGDSVKIKMTPPEELKTDFVIDLKDGPLPVGRVNTGVPHVIVQVTDIDTAPVFEKGREIRYHKAFAPAGTNVNFIQSLTDATLVIRTYERGVEDETLACGTGAVAGAIITASQFGMPSPVRLHTRSGGILTVHFSKTQERFHDVYLEGDARVIYAGELWNEAWK